MKFTPLVLPGLVLIEPRVWRDRRGCFMEFYNRRLFHKNGIRDDFVQDNHTRSRRGVLRGFHYQAKPREQAKLIRVAHGEIYDVVVDVRKKASTFGRWFGLRLSSKNSRMLYVPGGFAHGYAVLSRDAEVLYKVTDFYSPAHERGIRWDDPFFAVRWPRTGARFIVSDKDRAFPLWERSGGT